MKIATRMTVTSFMLLLGLKLGSGCAVAQETETTTTKSVQAQTTTESGNNVRGSEGRMRPVNPGMANDAGAEKGTGTSAPTQQAAPARRYFLSTEVEELRSLADDLREKGDAENAERAERIATRIQERAVRAFQNTAPTIYPPTDQIPPRLKDTTRENNRRLDNENRREARRDLRESERQMEQRRNEARRQRDESLDRVRRAREQADRDLEQFRRDAEKRSQNLNSGQKP